MLEMTTRLIPAARDVGDSEARLLPGAFGVHMKQLDAMKVWTSRKKAVKCDSSGNAISLPWLLLPQN